MKKIRQIAVSAQVSSTSTSFGMGMEMERPRVITVPKEPTSMTKFQSNG